MADNRTRRLMRMTMAADTNRNRDAESRFRDRRGRWHYDNGRFAPRSETNIGIEGRFRNDHAWDRRGDYAPGMRGGADMDYDPDMGYMPWLPPVYETDMRYDSPARQIGFMATGGELDSDYRSDAGYHNRGEMERHGSHAMSGYASGGEVPQLTREKAEQWVRSMQNANGTRGQNWNMEQARHIMSRYGFQCDPLEFYVALNMMKSDYSKVAAQLGVDKEEFYAAMAKAFLMDEDAHKDKLARYWQYVVKK